MQPLSFSAHCAKPNSTNRFRCSTPPTTDLVRRWYRALSLVRFALLFRWSLFFDVLFSGRHVRCLRDGQRLLLCDVEAGGRRLEVAGVASLWMVQRAGVFGEYRRAGGCSCRHTVSLYCPQSHFFIEMWPNQIAGLSGPRSVVSGSC